MRGGKLATGGKRTSVNGHDISKRVLYCINST